jgi:hypothetical protein
MFLILTLPKKRGKAQKNHDKDAAKQGRVSFLTKTLSGSLAAGAFFCVNTKAFPKRRAALKTRRQALKQSSPIPKTSFLAFCRLQERPVFAPFSLEFTPKTL